MATSAVHYDSDRVHIGVVQADAAYTAKPEDTLILGTATAAFTITLPAASAVRPGHMLDIKKIDSGSNAITLSRSGTDTIDGASTKSLSAQYDYLRLASDGVSTWYILGITPPEPSGS